MMLVEEHGVVHYLRVEAREVAVHLVVCQRETVAAVLVEIFIVVYLLHDDHRTIDYREVEDALVVEVCSGERSVERVGLRTDGDVQVGVLDSVRLVQNHVLIGRAVAAEQVAVEAVSPFDVAEHRGLCLFHVVTVHVDIHSRNLHRHVCRAVFECGVESLLQLVLGLAEFIFRHIDETPFIVALHVDAEHHVLRGSLGCCGAEHLLCMLRAEGGLLAVVCIYVAHLHRLVGSRAFLHSQTSVAVVSVGILCLQRPRSVVVAILVD